MLRGEGKLTDIKEATAHKLKTLSFSQKQVEATVGQPTDLVKTPVLTEKRIFFSCQRTEEKKPQGGWAHTNLLIMESDLGVMKPRFSQVDIVAQKNSLPLKTCS